MSKIVYATYSCACETSTKFLFHVIRLSRKIPLRDAVEYRAAPFFGGLDHDSIWIERLTPPSLRNIQSSTNVVCHLEARASYRPEPFALLPQSVPDRKCSHLIYSAATLGRSMVDVLEPSKQVSDTKLGFIFPYRSARVDFDPAGP